MSSVLEIKLLCEGLHATLRARRADFVDIDDIYRLTRICQLLADELERVDKALADKADEHPDEGIHFGGPINFPKQP